jgi:hypothetical protein
MTKTPFKQADVVRTVKSAQAAGLTVHVVEVVTPDGVTIRVSGPRCAATRNPWDEVLDEQNPPVRPPLDR